MTMMIMMETKTHTHTHTHTRERKREILFFLVCLGRVLLFFSLLVERVCAAGWGFHGIFKGGQFCFLERKTHTHTHTRGQTLYIYNNNNNIICMFGLVTCLLVCR